MNARPIQLLVLSRYDRSGASSRLRTFQYAPYLAAEGIEAKWEPFFDDAYLAGLYDGSLPIFALPRYVLRRLGALRRMQADAVWVEKEALPWLPAALELGLLGRKIPLIVDYDDAVFHRYDMHRMRAVRAALGGKIDAIMARADLVLAGNDYLAERAVSAGAAAVEIVPTVVDTGRYGQAASTGEPVIGWIGTPATWADYVLPLLPLLEALHDATGARIHAVGAPSAALPVRGLEVLPWSETTEVAAIQKMSLGIMPLTDTPWSRGKCAYKLIQYMACSLPVVASPVGTNRMVVKHGVNGFLAESTDEWWSALSRLLKDPAERARLGAAGRRRVEANFALESFGPKVARLIRKTVEFRQPRSTASAQVAPVAPLSQAKTEQ